jgi:glycosyltransferase involved in cell wall biosynthesis
MALRFFYGYPLGPVPSNDWSKRQNGFIVKFRLGELSESAVVSLRLLPELVKYQPDVMIVEDLSGLPNNLIAAIYCRLKRKPYLIWGLGNIPGKRRSLLRFFLHPVIRIFYSGAAGFICYSKHAEKVYSDWGKPTFIAPNATLERPEQIHINRIYEVISEKYSRSKRSIVAIGELKWQKRLDVLLHAIALLDDRNIELHIIGDGPERAALQSLSKELEITPEVNFHGAIYDDTSKGEIIERCCLGVLPGRGGLVIQELMFRGLPVICGAADGTERDNVVSGKTGFILENSQDPIEIADAIKNFLVLPDNEMIEMSREALLHTAKTYNVENMVAGVERAILFGIGERQGTSHSKINRHV